MGEFARMRISQDKLPSAIGLGRAVPNGRKCKPRAKGELRDPGIAYQGDGRARPGAGHVRAAHVEEEDGR